MTVSTNHDRIGSDFATTDRRSGWAVNRVVDATVGWRGGVSQPCLFVVPALSWRRDPAAQHKRAYMGLLADAFGAQLYRFRDERTVAEEVLGFDPSLVITMNVPWYGRVSDALIRSLPDSIKLVTVHDDFRRQMHRRLASVIERSDAVIAPIHTPVLERCQFPEIEDKFWSLPYFIPSDVHEFEFNFDSTRKCLLTGRVNSKYPIRCRALRMVPKDLISYQPHPGYGQRTYELAVTGTDYIALLHEHLCAITCGSIYRYVVAKYFEIPYAGTLLIAEDLPDLGRLGFEAGRHFVAIDQATDLRELVSDICRNPDNYRPIRQAGQELVRRQHTEAVRRVEAKALADEVLQFLSLESRTTSDCKLPPTVLATE